MSDTSFRTEQPSQPVKVEKLDQVKKEAHGDNLVEFPYTDYQKQHGNPFLVDYFGLGDTWSDPVGGYPNEISIIEGYLRDKIDLGEYPNTTEAIKSRLKSIEKVVALQKDERIPIRIETLAAYMKFMSEKDNIRRKQIRYGNI